MRNPVHVFRCSECGSLYAFEEGREPDMKEPTGCPLGRFVHLPELCRPGLHRPADPPGAEPPNPLVSSGR